MRTIFKQTSGGGPLTQALGLCVRFVVSSLIKLFETRRVSTSRLPGETYQARFSGHVAAPRSVPVKTSLPTRPTFIA